MIKVKLEDGFEVSVDERVLTDWRFTNALVKSQKGTDWEKLEAAHAMADMLIGKDVDKLCDHIASTNDGYVPSDVFMNKVAEVMQSMKQAKN